MPESLIGTGLTALAYIVGAAVFFVFSSKRGFTNKEISWILLASLTGGIIGAKVTRLAFAAAAGAPPQSLWAHPDGRTIIGGILFGWLAVEIVKKS